MTDALWFGRVVLPWIAATFGLGWAGHEYAKRDEKKPAQVAPSTGKDHAP